MFDVEQAKQFIAAISSHKYEVLFGLAITTGTRPSEYLALTWAISISDLPPPHVSSPKSG